MIQAQTKGSRTGIEKKFTQGGGAPRPVVMVCLSSSPSNKRVIRTAARTAFPIQTGTVPPEPQKSLSPGQSAGVSPGQTKTVSPGSKETRGKPAEVLPGKTPPGRAPIALFVGIDGKEPEADSMLAAEIVDMISDAVVDDEGNIPEIAVVVTCRQWISISYRIPCPPPTRERSAEVQKKARGTWRIC